jgi:hypothetical protein
MSVRTPTILELREPLRQLATQYKTSVSDGYPEWSLKRAGYAQLRKELWETYAPETWQDPANVPHYSTPSQGKYPWPAGLSPAMLEWILLNAQAVETVTAYCREAMDRWHRASREVMPERYRRKPVPPFALTWHPCMKMAGSHHLIQIHRWADCLVPDEANALGEAIAFNGIATEDGPLNAYAFVHVYQISANLAPLLDAKGLPNPYEPLTHLGDHLVAVHRTRSWDQVHDFTVKRYLELEMPVSKNGDPLDFEDIQL